MKSIVALSLLVVSAAANYYGGQSAPAMGYQQQQQSAPQGYGGGYGAAVRTAPVETVRVSYSSQDSGYGASSSPAGGYAGQSAPAASSYGPSSYSSAPAQSSYGGSSYGSSTRNNVQILRHNQEITPGSSHSYDFATGDGISHSETTSVQGGGYGGYGSGSGITKQGQFSYTSPEGQPISLTYVADSQGFRPSGAHLPTPPPMPQEIAQSLRAQGYSGY